MLTVGWFACHCTLWKNFHLAWLQHYKMELVDARNHDRVDKLRCNFPVVPNTQVSIDRIRCVLTRRNFIQRIQWNSGTYGTFPPKALNAMKTGISSSLMSQFNSSGKSPADFTFTIVTRKTEVNPNLIEKLRNVVNGTRHYMLGSSCIYYLQTTYTTYTMYTYIMGNK